MQAASPRTGGVGRHHREIGTQVRCVPQHAGSGACSDPPEEQRKTAG